MVEKPGGVEKQLSELEGKAYQWQVQIFDVHLNILHEEELQIREQMNTVKRQIAG